MFLAQTAIGGKVSSLNSEIETFFVVADFLTLFRTKMCQTLSKQLAFLLAAYSSFINPNMNICM
jgi:hypothetical protein